MTDFARLVKRIVMCAIAVAYFLATRTVGRVLGWTPRSSPVILTYHSVRQEEVTRFERQMRHLKRTTATVFADTTAVTADRPCVALTFDDAFQNVFEWAVPVLAAYEIPAMVLVPTGYLGASPGWIVSEHNPQRAMGTVASEGTLRGLDRRLVRLGSHTVTHPRLSTLDDRRLYEELSMSKERLEEISRAPVTTLALPYGSCTPKIVDAARRVGYERVFANVPLAKSTSDSTGLVGRIDVSPRDWIIEFGLKVRGAYDWMALAIPAKREVLRLLGKTET